MCYGPNCCRTFGRIETVEIWTSFRCVGRIVANFGADQYDVAGRVDFRGASACWLNCSRSPTNYCQRFQSRTIQCVSQPHLRKKRAIARFERSHFMRLFAPWILVAVDSIRPPSGPKVYDAQVRVSTPLTTSLRCQRPVGSHAPGSSSGRYCCSSQNKR